MATCKICNKWKETVPIIVQHLMSEKPDHGLEWSVINDNPAEYYTLDPGMQVPQTPKRPREDDDDEDKTWRGGPSGSKFWRGGAGPSLTHIPTNVLLMEIASRCR